MTAAKGRCACRSAIDIETPDDPAVVERVLSLHYAQPEHVAWRDDVELLAEKVPPLRVPVAQPEPTRLTDRQALGVRLTRVA